MKKIITTLILIALGLSLSAQQLPSTEAFIYQAIARDNAGNVLANQNISFRINILHLFPDGNAVFVETHESVTNEFGMINLEIGNGEPETGSISEIDWGFGPYFLQIEMDATGGTNYQLLGTSQLLSVPYALYSASSGDAGATEIDDLTDGRTLGNSVYLGLHAGANDQGPDNQNVAVGFGALTTNTSGDYNAANGAAALFSNTTGYRNTANGYRALFSNEEGGYNTANGYNAMYDNITGSYNTASGAAALSSNTIGGWNTANGYQALFSNIEGDFNTANGLKSLYSNTTGTRNTANGFASNLFNEEGSNNTIIGYSAGRGTSAHNKSGNVFLGYQAGYNATFGTDTNVFLGYQAGYNETGANKLYIENSASSTPLIYGDFDNDILAFNADVGIGTLAPTADLHVDDTNGVLFSGTYGKGEIPTEGGGTRLMWYPAKAAFRAGRVSGSNWDDDNIGSGSVAMGYNTIASGGNSVAMGYGAEATGHNTTAMGWYTNANSYASVAIGRINVGGGNPTEWVETDPLFEIGYGYAVYPNPVTQRNAFTVLKNGNVGIGTPTPAGILDIAGAYHFPGNDGNSGQVLQTNGSGTLYWGNNANTYSVGDFAHGGIVFWVDETGQHGLACYLFNKSSECWSDPNAINPGPNLSSHGDGIGSGEMNTMLIVAYSGDGNEWPYAALICADLIVWENNNMYGDWYLPSKYELNLMYLNKDIINTTATANSGHAFENDRYWSSTLGVASNGDGPWIQDFNDGSQSITWHCVPVKYVYSIRAIKAF